MSTVTSRRVGDSQDLLGESPFWDDRTQAVCWIDSLGGRLHRHWPTTGASEVHRLPAPVGSVSPCASGAVVVALQHGFARYDWVARTLQPLATIAVTDPDVRLNDGKCDPWGNFVAGTLHSHRPEGAPLQGGLYRLRPEGTVERIAEGFTLTNGPCFSRDGRTLYVADSPVRTIWAYDYAPDGPLGERRSFARTEVYGAGPDGATVDADGCLWTVLPRIGRMARFTPDGQLERMVELPTTHPTSLCFGGPGHALAYVTSLSRSTNLTGSAPQDGGLFEIGGLPAAGLRAHVFADGARP